MKKKINSRFIGIAIFSILITLTAVTAAFYSRFKTQVFSDLEIIAELLSCPEGYYEDYGKRYENGYDGRYRELPEDIRVTLIDEKGKVWYDSAADADALGNHLDRPEVREALEKGHGQEIRKSDTLSESVFYYAVQMENGQVLRVGKESASVIWLFVSSVPIAVVMAFVLAVICVLASHYLTADIVSPIDTMAENMDYLDESGVYEELRPFMRKIRTQHEEILSAADIRQEFTANVTHELKTPLTAISGYAELMESGVAKETDIRRFSGEIRKSAARLLALINDVIKLSRLDAGNAGDVLEIVDLAVIAADTVEMLSLHAAEMKVSLSYQGCSSAKIRIGRESAEELAYNLIENAIRYNKPGGRALVSVTQEERLVSFTVSDTGIGIPREHQERIFERFYRVDKSRSKELGGTGLGLAIVKHICSLTRGKLSLDSKEGQGTSVTVTWDNTMCLF